VLAPDPESILLIRRAERPGDRWSGQMAFPGGRRGPEDSSLLATARRETLEEVGLDLGGARVLGQLDDSAPRSPTLPPLVVRPFVFHLPKRGNLSLNHEVDAAVWVPLGALAEAAVYRPYPFVLGEQTVMFPGYHLAEGVVWGMTERILTPFLQLLGIEIRSRP